MLAVWLVTNLEPVYREAPDEETIREAPDGETIHEAPDKETIRKVTIGNYQFWLFFY